MMGLIGKLSLIIVLLILSKTAYADYYLGETVAKFYSGRPYPSSNAIVQLNETNFIYVAGTNLNDGLQFGLYLQSTVTDEVKLLTLLPYYDAGTYGAATITVGENGALVDFFGSLYWTDGTSAGTKSIANVGRSIYGYDEYSNVCAIEYINNKFFLVINDFENTDSGARCGEAYGGTPENLWTYSSNTDQFTKVTNQPFGRISSVFDDHTKSGSEILFLATNTDSTEANIWRTNGVPNDAELIVAFPAPPSFNEFRTAYQRPVKTSKGWFFCDHDRTSPDGDSYWVTRLSNSLTLDRVTNQCGVSGLRVFNDELYFTSSINSESALWASSGIVGNRRLVKSFEPDYSVPTVCIARGKINFYTYHPTEGTMYWQSGGSSTNTIETTAVAFSCDDYLLYERKIYNLVENTSTKAFNVSSLRYTRLNKFGEYFYGLGQTEETFNNIKIIKITKHEGQYIGFMPAIQGVLED